MVGHELMVVEQVCHFPRFRGREILQKYVRCPREHDALSSVMQPGGFNVGFNLGAAAGASVGAGVVCARAPDVDAENPASAGAKCAVIECDPTANDDTASDDTATGEVPRNASKRRTSRRLSGLS